MFIYLVSSLCVYKYVLIAGGYLTHVLIASRRKQTKRELVFFCAYTLPKQSTLCIKREKNYDFFFAAPFSGLSVHFCRRRLSHLSSLNFD